MITTDLQKVKEILDSDDIVAIPTETVYGLAGNALSISAVEKIYKLKNRPFYNPLIVHIKSIEQLETVAQNIPKKASELAKVFWPGPLTLVLEKQQHIPGMVTSGKSTVAVRMPNHPLTLELLHKLAYPLAAPSANPFGSISPTAALHVHDYFKDELKAVLDGGECERGIESTIIGFENDEPVLYRLGSISQEDIEDVIGKINSVDKNNTEIKSPGMLARHYAPGTRTLLTDDLNETITANSDKRIGLLLFKKRLENAEIEVQEILSGSGDLKEAAKNLYAALHRLDHQNLDLIIAEKLPDNGLGKSINDRLLRATK